MAVTGVIINTAVAGDDFDIDRTVTGVPAGQTITKGWFTAKSLATDPDVNAIVQKTITTILVAGEGHITDDGADGSGAITFALTQTNTRAIGTAGTLFYDIQIRTSAGKVYTLETGQISVLGEITLTAA